MPRCMHNRNILAVMAGLVGLTRAAPRLLRQWSRIALVAVADMELHGRRVLWARSVAGAPEAVAAAGNLAAARFWFLRDDLPPLVCSSFG